MKRHLVYCMRHDMFRLGREIRFKFCFVFLASTIKLCTLSLSFFETINTEAAQFESVFSQEWFDWSDRYLVVILDEWSREIEESFHRTCRRAIMLFHR